MSPVNPKMVRGTKPERYAFIKSVGDMVPGEAGRFFACEKKESTRVRTLLYTHHPNKRWQVSRSEEGVTVRCTGDTGRVAHVKPVRLKPGSKTVFDPTSDAEQARLKRLLGDHFAPDYYSEPLRIARR